MKKMLLLGLIVCSLLIVQMPSIVAAEKEISIDDDTGDVLYYVFETEEEGYTSEHPNIDIENVTAIQDGKKVELQLKLVEDGKVQNSEYIFYVIILITSLNQYEVYYMAGECFVYDNEYNELSGVVCSGVGTRTLSVVFDLLNSDEECQNLQATTYEADEEYNEYSDMAPDEEDFLNVDAGGPYEGVVGESINFSGTAFGGSSPYMWEWDLDGDGSIDATEQTPTYTYEEAGEYNVTLTVTDNDGSKVTDTTTVTISADGDGGDGDTDGTSSDSDKDDSSDLGLLLFGAVIAIIVIVGIIAVIVIIRR